MPERIDPDGEPTLDLNRDLAPAAPASIEQPPDLQPRWRRPALLVAGASLLTLGAFVNADRFDHVDHVDRDDDDDRRELAFEEEEPEPEVAPGEPDDQTGGSGTRHKGEEGKMGKPSAGSKSGMYAMKGPANAVPSLARNYDPSSAPSRAGILGVMQQQGGHYLASPYGGAFAVGNEDEAEWGGLSGVGLVGTGRGGGGDGQGVINLGGGHDPQDAIAERYAELLPNSFVKTTEDPKSTFSIDVDTASYANVRRFLINDNQLPPPAAVRTEELINYFDYDYAQPSGDAPFSVMSEVGPCPWNTEHRLVHVGVQGKIIEAGEVPPRNLVFLLDVSGSMAEDGKLPLVKHGLAALTEQLDEHDRVSIVVYAGAAGVVLPPTSGADKQTILGALDQLHSGGSTNGGEGIELAYALAEQHFVKDGVNRVVLATDGDFNVGVASHEGLIELIAKKRETGVFLSVLGFGSGNLNDHTMEQLADKGNGNYAYIDGMFEARKVLVAEAGATLVTIAKDVKIQVEFDPDQVVQHRLVGYENRIMAHHEFDDDRKDAGEIGAGHSVTAIYEITPGSDVDDDDPLMQLNLRYKQPDGDESRKISVAVEDHGKALAASSDDYRFAAAVAAFSERLRGARGLSHAQILELAEGSLGADAQCYRHQFLELVRRAASLAGEQLRPSAATTCTPRASEPRKQVAVAVEVEVEVEQPDGETDDEGWQAFVLEVLRLLPPFLALPMFVMALRKPRRKR